jgi:hypothetical protein
MKLADAVVGHRVGRLTIVSTEYVQKSTYRKLYAVCLCDCGKSTKIQVNSLGPNTSSCGCGQGEAQTTHGMANSKTYRAWAAMKARAASNSPATRPHYKDRGITVTVEWDSFEQFYRDMGDKPEGLTLERINNDKGYFKDNCRWATKDEQERNKTTSVFVMHNLNGKMIFADACRKEGINIQCATSRLRKGKSLQVALSNEAYVWYKEIT